MACSDRCSPLRKRQVSSPMVSETTSPLASSSTMAVRISSAVHLQQLLGQSGERLDGQGAVTLVRGGLEGERDAARMRCGAVFSIPSLAAMASAVLKPIPRTSLASRYGSSVMT